MKAIFNREVKSYFKSVTGYIFGSLLLALAGIYTVIVCLDGGSPNFEYVLADMPFIFIIIVPLITMRCIADERRQHTDQLLYSLPLGMTHVVLGKYFAMILVVLIPMLLICCIPIILNTLGTVNFYAAYSSVIGFTMLAAALVAIGMFISSLTDNVATAAGLCFLVMLFNYFLSSLALYIPGDSSSSFMALGAALLLTGFIMWLLTKNIFGAAVFFMALETTLYILYIRFPMRFAGLFAAIMKRISLFERFSLFRYAIFDLTAVFYYFSVCVLFLFMTVQCLEKRRWS